MTPPIGRDDRHHRLRRRAQVADEELALELQPRDEEEDREQAVAGPLTDGEVEVAPLDADHGVAQGEVGIRPGGVRQDEGGDGGGEQQRATDRLGAQRLGDRLGLGPAGPVQDGRPALGGGGRRVVRGGRVVGGGARFRACHACSPAVGDASSPAGSRGRCRPDFPALRGQSIDGRRSTRGGCGGDRPLPSNGAGPARGRRGVPGDARHPCFSRPDVRWRTNRSSCPGRSGSSPRSRPASSRRRCRGPRRRP